MFDAQKNIQLSGCCGLWRDVYIVKYFKTHAIVNIFPSGKLEIHFTIVTFVFLCAGFWPIFPFLNSLRFFSQ